MSKQDGIGTWVWNFSYGLYEFGDGDYSVDFSSSDGVNIFHYTAISFTGSGTPFASIVYGSENVYYSGSGWVNDGFQTIDIKTAPPAEFLTILQASATYQEPKLTDLTGTTWKWNSSIVFPTDKPLEWTIDFSSQVPNTSNIFTILAVDVAPNTMVFYVNDEGDFDVCNEDGWYDETSRLISITGGTDATNTDLIDYMYANAELQGSAPVPVQYNVVKNAVDCSIIGADTVETGKTYNYQIAPNTGFTYPTSVSVIGAEYTYTQADGKIVISNITGEVTITVRALARTFSVTFNVTNATVTGETTITAGGTYTYQITPNSGYTLPESVTVDGATLVDYSPTTGALEISTPSANVTISGSAVIRSFQVTANLTHCTKTGGVSAVDYGGSGFINVACDVGYILRSGDVRVTGATLIGVTEVENKQYRIDFENATNTVVIVAVGVVQMVGVTIDTQNCTVTTEVPTEVAVNTGFSFTVLCDNKYHLNSGTVTVVGATLDGITPQANNRYIVAIRDVESDVTVTLRPVFVPTNIYTYTFKDLDGSNLLVLENQEPLVGMFLNIVLNTVQVTLRYNDGTSSAQAFQIKPQVGFDFRGLATSTTATSATILLGENEFIANSNLTFYPFFVKKQEPPVGTQLQLNVYQNKAEANRVDKTDYLLYVKTLNGTFRTETDLLDIQVVVEDDLPNYNYIYIPQLKRYYFVDGITSVRYRLWELSLSVDVLMTYRDGIKQLKAFVDRNQYSVNNDIIDPKRVVEQGYDVEDNSIENALFTTPHSFVLTGFALKANDTAKASVVSVEETADKGVE